MIINKRAVILRQVKKTLKVTFNKYKKDGMTSIYLWGSITGEDFNPKESDVDSIALVKDIFPLSYEDKIIEEIQKLSPKIKDFKIRLVYLSELNKDDSIGNLTKYISSRQLLFDMEYWLLVCGKRYSKDDFKIDPDLNKIIQEEKNQIKKGFQEIKSDKRKDGQYLGKAILRLIYYLEQTRNKAFSFSYKNLLKYSTRDNQEILRKLNSIKKNGWKIEELNRIFKIISNIK